MMALTERGQFLVDFSQKLDGREYRRELTYPEEKDLNLNDFLCVFGASDDLLEMRGYFNDEYGSYNGTKLFLYILENGKLAFYDEEHKSVDDFPTEKEFVNYIKSKKTEYYIESKWCERSDISWTFYTNFPSYKKFIISDDFVLYSEGLLIDMKDLNLKGNMQEMTVFDKIESWASDRNLINGSDPVKQTVKLMEEVGELSSGVCRNKLNIIEDSIGDSIVVLTILAKQYGLDVMTCVEKAYDTIKDRKGKMVNGVFIKEEDLTK